MRRRYKKNPLSENAKWGLVVLGGLAAAGTLAYFATRPSEPASVISIPSQFIHAHRYQMDVSTDAANVDASRVSALTVADAQKEFDSFVPGAVKVISFSAKIEGGRAIGQAVFDVIGPTQAGISLPPGFEEKVRAEHGMIAVKDLGVSPAGIAGVPKQGGAPLVVGVGRAAQLFLRRA